MIRRIALLLLVVVGVMTTFVWIVCGTRAWRNPVGDEAALHPSEVER